MNLPPAPPEDHGPRLRHFLGYAERPWGPEGEQHINWSAHIVADTYADAWKVWKHHVERDGRDARAVAVIEHPTRMPA